MILITLIGVTLATFGFLLVVMRYLLKDFTRFLHKITKDVFHTSTDTYYWGEVLLTLFTCIVISAVALVFMKSAMALVACLFSKDLVSFFTVLRGVYDISYDVQHPMHYLIPGLLITPVVQFFTVFLIFKSIRIFFRRINKRYSGTYSESDALYFGFIIVLLLALLDIGLFARGSVSTKSVVYFTLLAVSKIALPFFYLTLSHINMLRGETYRKALPEYVSMTSVERKISFSPWRFLIFAYFISILLLLPFHFGIHFIRSDWQVFFLFMVVCITIYFLLKYTLAKGWNFLGTIMLNDSLHIEEITDNLYSLSPNLRKIGVWVFIAAMGGFAIIHWDLFLLALAIAVFPILISVVGLAAVYFIGSVLPHIQRLFTEGISQIFNTKVVRPYFANVAIALSKAILPCSMLIFTVFMILSLFPKPLDYSSKNIVASLVDKNGDVLYIDHSKDVNYCIPLKYDDIPPFVLTCIYNQEDKNFRNQRNWAFNKSNWHGISPAFIFSNRGGSNINMQLIKNLAIEGSFPLDLSRKLAELFCSYQLSISEQPNDIITWYVNSVGFWGAKGFSGLEAASLHAFGRPVNQLNKLEQVCLIATLPRSSSFKISGDREISYAEAEKYPLEIKQFLIDKKAKPWFDKGLISKKEFNQLKRDSLQFSNRFYKADVTTSSRLFYEKQIANYAGAKYTCSVTKEIQKGVQSAYEDYRTNRHFPPTLRKDGCDLYSVALVVNYKTGEIVGHFSNHTEDMSSFGQGWSMASLVKPFCLLQMLEEEIPIRLYDGAVSGKKTPLNANKTCSNTYVDETTILPQSLNVPMVNIREVTNALQLYKNIEDKFAAMGITPHHECCNDVYNYPMGSRAITLIEIAQSYQTLLNDGLYSPLHILSTVFDPATNTEKTIPTVEPMRIYKKENTDKIKIALNQTINGTGFPLKSILPQDKTYYIKTGTSNDGANHGYCVLADESIMIVSWMSYGQIKDGVLQLNQTPSVPYSSGGKSAGVFAAYIYNQLVEN